MNKLNDAKLHHDISKLIQLMQGLVVFLRICVLRKRRDGTVRNPQDGKRVAHKWKELTLTDMTPTWLDCCARWPGAIAVKLGRVNIGEQCEHGLYALDTDIDAEVTAVEALNPWTADTYRQRGGKGAQWLFRGAGDWPGKTIALYDSRHVDPSGNFRPWGEFRSDGGISILDGEYAHGGHYQGNGESATTIRFADFVLPPHVSAHRRALVTLSLSVAPSTPTTPEPEPRPGPQTQDLAEPALEPPAAALPRLNAAPGNTNFSEFVRPYLPHAKGNHHNALLFELACLIKLRQAQGLAIGIHQVFAAWWQKAQKFCPSTLGPDFYLMEFQRAVACARGGALAEAWTASEGLVAPGSQVLTGSHFKRLAAFCYALQRKRGDGRFLLPYRVCAFVFEPLVPGCDRMDAFSWFEVLQFTGLVQKVMQGLPGDGNKGSGKANEWRYTGRNGPYDTPTRGV
jgi:hypothetical protein